MPAYEFTALDAKGSEQRGRIDADSERTARQMLRARGWFPTLVRDGDPGRGVQGSALGPPAWSRSQRVQVVRQLAVLLQAGMPLEAALVSIAEQADDADVAQIVRLMRVDVSSGLALSAAMAAQGFGTLDTALARVAEKTGQLDAVLNDLAQHHEASDAFRQRVTVALVYPMAILVIAAAVVGALVFYVMPQIVEVFVRQKQALPLLTRLLIGFSDMVRAAWLPALLVVIASIWPVARLLARPRVRERLRTLAGRLPVVGRLLRMAGTQRFAAVLAMALKGGIPLVPALGLTREVLALPAQKQAVDRITEAVGRGASLGSALQGERGVAFEPALRHFVVLGEQNGRLAEMLSRASHQQRSLLEFRLGWLTGLLEPALVVSLGVVVLLIVLAILMPIIEINQFLR